MKKIMIVDDNKDFLDEMTVFLSSNGYETIPVKNGFNAVKEATRKNPDLILLDLRMKGISGFQVADELSRVPETMHIPVIAVTGVFVKDEHRLLMRVCRIKECLTKPVDPARMLQVIEAVA